MPNENFLFRIVIKERVKWVAEKGGGGGAGGSCKFVCYVQMEGGKEKR